MTRLEQTAIKARPTSSPGEGWVFQQKPTASDGASGDRFGSAVALSGATIAIGASNDSFGTTLSQGSAYLFTAPACPALTLNPASLPNGTTGVAYQQLLSATGGAGPYSFTASAGALPAGLTLTNGLIVGTPTQAGGQAIANNALAAVGNATVVIPAGVGYLTFWPNGASQPLVATTNFTSGQIFNRHFTVGLGATGIFNIFASAQTDLVIDVSGYFAP